MPIPPKLYKFRAFNVRTLRLITDSETYYADPATFNDPMDCDPVIDVDLKLSELGALYRAMVGPAGVEDAKRRLRRHSERANEMQLPPKSLERQKYLAGTMAVDLKMELKRELGAKGVLSFARTWNSPLMWSHYADEHKGICLQYDTGGMPHPELRPVDYNASRIINASDLYKWKIDHDGSARDRVCQTYFYAKAPHWKYEREWRDLRGKVEAGSSYGISAIYFGQRCDDAARIAVVKMLADHPTLRLYDIAMNSDGFGLTRQLVDRGEIESLGIRPPMEIMMHRFVQDLEDFEEDDPQEDMLTDLSR